MITKPLTEEAPAREVPATSTPVTSPRLVQLDILRGVAILFVLGHHPVISFRQAGLLKIPATMWFRIGWTGVDLFFVLSGFLVGGLLFKELNTTGKLDAKRFIIRRGFKIWPSYYLFLVVQFFWLWLYNCTTPGAAWHSIIPGIFHYQNYAGTGWHTWSLAIEEHFYLMLPLLLLAAGHFGKRTMLSVLPIAAISVMLFCVTYRTVVGWTPPFDVHRVYFPTHARMDSLFYGVLLAYCYHFFPRLFHKIASFRLQLLISAAVLLLPFTILPEGEKKFVWTVGYTVLYLAYGALLIGFTTAPVKTGRWHRFFTNPILRGISWVGRYSYSIYLWHFFVKLAIEDFWPHTFLKHWHPVVLWIVLMTVYVVAAISVGVFLGRIVEMPALKLRDRLFASRASAL